MWGFVLLNLAVGKEKDFFYNLGSVQGVRGVFYLFDEYEYLVELEGTSPEELAKLMNQSIRRLPGVERTATFIEGDTTRRSSIEREPLVASEPKLVW